MSFDVKPSKMSSKKCIYTNCTSTGSGEITLFAFPKDEARRQSWLELAGRSGHTLQKSDCLCELHFGRQFISSNQRRKVLVGVSIPFRYDQINENGEDDNEDDDEHQIEALEDCERLDIDEIFVGDDDDQQEEDVVSYTSNSAMEQVTVEDYTPETITCDQPKTAPDKMKRKMIEHSPQNGISKPVKLIKIDVNKTKPNGNEPSTIKPQRKVDEKPKPLPNTPATIVDHPDVSIFNIRGEEFIQMPKSVYLEEKAKLESSHMDMCAKEIIKLREELNKYKNAIAIIKNQLKSFP